MVALSFLFAFNLAQRKIKYKHFFAGLGRIIITYKICHQTMLIMPRKIHGIISDAVEVKHYTILRASKPRVE